jgi:hypothetical protein
MRRPRESTIELATARNEPEALAIEAELRDHGIEVRIARHQSRAYPGIVDRDAPHAWIRVAEDDGPRARAILERWREETAHDVVTDAELARAAMEADDTDPEERARMRAALASADRGGAYRGQLEGGGARGAHAARTPREGLFPRLVLAVAVIALVWIVLYWLALGQLPFGG